MASDEIVFKLKIHISEHTDKLLIESEVVGGRFYVVLVVYVNM